MCAVVTITQLSVTNTFIRTAWRRVCTLIQLDSPSVTGCYQWIYVGRVSWVDCGWGGPVVEVVPLRPVPRCSTQQQSPFEYALLMMGCYCNLWFKHNRSMQNIFPNERRFIFFAARKSSFVISSSTDIFYKTT